MNMQMLISDFWPLGRLKFNFLDLKLRILGKNPYSLLLAAQNRMCEKHVSVGENNAKGEKGSFQEKSSLGFSPRNSFTVNTKTPKRAKVIFFSPSTSYRDQCVLRATRRHNFKFNGDALNS
jgi:hypothetical protein